MSLLPRGAPAIGRAAGESPPLLFVGGFVDTHVYIDGFNLYYALLKSRPNKWLDLEKFCDRLLPRNTVRKIYYFTAKVDARPHDPDQPTRQLAYLQALATLPRVEVHLGNFMTQVVSQVVVEPDPTTGRPLRAAGVPVVKTDADMAASSSKRLRTSRSIRASISSRVHSFPIR